MPCAGRARPALETRRDKSASGRARAAAARGTWHADRAARGLVQSAACGPSRISLTALKRLGLDRVWWLVSPGNPLKDPARLPALEARVEAARKVARHPRIDVTGYSGGSAYSIDLLTALKRRFPGVQFVWLMGADNLAEFHRWRDWEQIFGLVPIAVFDRPGYRQKALASRAAQRFGPYQVDETDAGGLALLIPPAWTLITHRLSGLSSTALRAKAEAITDKKKTKNH